MNTLGKRQNDYMAAIEGVMRAAAKPMSLDINDLGDCMQDYEAKRIAQIRSPPENWDTTALLASLKRDIIWHMRAWVRNQRRSKRRLESLEQLELDVKGGKANEPASAVPGPEQLALNSVAETNLAAAEECLTFEQRRLWDRHVGDGVRLVDLQQEFGKTANALRQMMHTSRLKLRERLEDRDASGP